MTEKHTCSICSRTFRGWNEEDLIEKIQDHFQRTHSIEIEKNQVSEKITM